MIPRLLQPAKSSYPPILPSQAPLSDRLRSFQCCGLNILTSKRYSRILLVSIFCFATVVVLWHVEPAERIEFGSVQYSVLPAQDPLGDGSLPPLYEQYHEYERNLPQHDMELPAPDGKSARFIFSANHAWGSGWGNTLQEMIMNAHLAYATKRAFVFYNYTWDRHEDAFSDFNGKVIPSRVPVSTMLSGPIVGGSWTPELAPYIPRAVSSEYFYKVCQERTVIHTEDVKSALTTGDGVTILQTWVDKINSIEDRCIEIYHDSNHIFDFWLFGSTDIHSLWPIMAKSPILTQFNFSPLILLAYTANRHHFITPKDTSLASYFPSIGGYLPALTYSEIPRPPASAPPLSTPIPGLMVLHLRRGDFEDHCRHLARYGSTYNGYNSFPHFPDRFDPSILGMNSQEWNEDRAYNELYKEHCYPDIDQIIKRVGDIRRSVDERRSLGQGNSWLSRLLTWIGSSDADLHPLRRIYVMTNGKNEWLDELKSALVEDGWELNGISTSRDLELTWEQKYVSQALDMYVAARAQVFVGNGFSSLTSNTVMLRMANNMDPLDTRFW
ncbi:ATP:ADP antiporter [Moniliophthora roreri MCA 2997]|nr:ATP:ADP antiporter [Moniliophthora roreri MCA 2997]